MYTSNEDYAAKGPAPAEEKAERNRIWRDALKAGLSSGTVHVYILDPDGKVIDSQHVAVAAKVDELTAMLERVVERLHTPAGEPIVAPACQSRAPQAAADALVLHLIARNLVRQGNELVPVQAKLGENRSGNWGAYPVEDWIVLERADWRKLLPAGVVEPGSAWDLDHDAAARVLTHFYPSTENNDLRKNRIDQLALRATVLSVQDGVARARLDGSLKMKHPFYHKDDDNVVEATVVGMLDFEPATRQIRSLQLATDRATYGRTHFGVVVSSLAPGSK